jgi:flavin reductase (DIM6/NTAB) family NADH-FMN oxidoreductase RutF
MDYAPELGDHGLPHDPFKAIVAPRPIGWITAMSASGAINLSPYSYFNAISARPHMVMFSSEGLKDAVSFIAETKEFTCSLVTKALDHQMNMTSAPLPRGANEYDYAGLAMAPSRKVRAPRVALSPAALECALVSIQQLPDMHGVLTDRYMVIGQVVSIFIDDAFIKNGRFDTAAAHPIARCGYADYAEVTSLFSITRPAGAGG